MCFNGYFWRVSSEFVQWFKIYFAKKTHRWSHRHRQKHHHFPSAVSKDNIDLNGHLMYCFIQTMSMILIWHVYLEFNNVMRWHKLIKKYIVIVVASAASFLHFFEPLKIWWSAPVKFFQAFQQNFDRFSSLSACRVSQGWHMKVLPTHTLKRTGTIVLGLFWLLALSAHSALLSQQRQSASNATVSVWFLSHAWHVCGQGQTSSPHAYPSNIFSIQTQLISSL